MGISDGMMKVAGTMTKAADEITRLRAERDALRKALEKIDAFPIPAAARKILRAALQTKGGE